MKKKIVESIKKLKNIFLKFKKDTYFIESDEDKFFVKSLLENERIIAIDTEFDWRNTYFPKLSLLQISTSKNIFLIDCLKCKELKYLKTILERKNLLIIFHSARSDTTVLSTNLNIKLKRVFDIQVAQQLLEKKEIRSYASLVQLYFSVNLEKNQTTSNWLKRPLSNEQLEYASDDVNYLIEIYKKQSVKLKKMNLYKLAKEKSLKQAILGNEKLFVSRIKKINKASNFEKDIFLKRERYAAKKNIPTSYIFADKNLKEIAKNLKKDEYNSEKVMKLFKSDSLALGFFEYIKL
tara:strand:- start:998 stop:1876 length:879 start_codon:yes stop_codon:yes gene_type:complete